MSETANPSAPSPTLALGKWLGLVVSAVVLAEGIWATLVSLTRSLLVPLMARAVGANAQSPLGKGDFNLPDLFVSVVELCLAGIVFLSIKIWATRGAPSAPRVRRVAAPARLPVEEPASIAPPAPAAVQTIPAPPAVQVVPAPVLSPPPPAISQEPTPAPKPAPPPIPPQPPSQAKKSEKAKKPEKPKEVYYNIVGEPITPDDE